MKLHEIERAMLRNPIDLIGKKVHVRKNSSHAARLRNLSEEIGGDILILEDFGDVQSETLIKRVADGEIQFTVADENVALVNATYYPDLDVKTPVSFSQKNCLGSEEERHFLDFLASLSLGSRSEINLSNNSFMTSVCFSTSLFLFFSTSRSNRIGD